MFRRMARVAPTVRCSPADQHELKRLAARRTEPKQTVERARMVLGCLAGQRGQAVARHTHPNIVIKWRQRFVARGLNGLRDAPRPGAQRVYDETFRNRVLATLEQPRPPVKARGTGRRWPQWCKARSMRCGGCCARKAFVCSGSGPGA